MPPQVKTPVTFRRFDDPTKIRRAIFDGVMNSVKSKYPLENDRYRMELTDLSYGKPHDFSLKEQKEALLSRNSLYWKLKGNWRMVDKSTGKIVDERPAVVAHVPYMTQRGTFIYRGNEYTVANQMRLRPGVYTRKKDNGELEAHFNVMPGSGSSFRVFMDPASGVFKARMGQANIPLYPLMKSMGVSDDQMKKWWGNELLNANRQKQDPQAVQKAYKRMVGGSATEPQQQITELGMAFDRMKMDPDVMQRSLGKWLDQQEQPEPGGIA
jgi:DNA-directed RNA polymerase beta subunit